MPLASKPSNMSPVVLAFRGRVVQRLLALVAFGVFVGGMVVAAGLGEQVVVALPFAAAGVAAAFVVWGTWRLRPWRLVGVATRGVARGARAAHAGTVHVVHAATATVHWSGRIVRRSGGFVRTASRRLYMFATRPREPWRLPPALVSRANRTRAAAQGLIDRCAPVRCRTDVAWRAFATDAVEHMIGFVNGQTRAAQRLLKRRRRLE